MKAFVKTALLAALTFPHLILANEDTLAELGLDGDGRNMGIVVLGYVLIFLGLVVIGVSVWYYLRPGSIPEHD